MRGRGIGRGNTPNLPNLSRWLRGCPMRPAAQAVSDEGQQSFSAGFSPGAQVISSMPAPSSILLRLKVGLTSEGGNPGPEGGNLFFEGGKSKPSNLACFFEGGKKF